MVNPVSLPFKNGPTDYYYVTGTFSGTVTFGPYTLVTAGYEDVFVAKFDAADSYAWVTQAGGTNSDISNDLAFDNKGNMYVAGSFKSHQADFGNKTLSQFNSSKPCWSWPRLPRKLLT